MKYIIDIDGTICTKTVNDNYEFAEPYVNRIKHFNGLYDQGHEIYYWTARGGTSHKDWSELTKAQLKQWNVKYSSVNFGKPSYDIWIDDKAINDKDYFDDINNRR